MERLIELLSKNYNLLLFLGLELIGFSILVKFNNNQHTMFSDFMMSFASRIQTANSNLYGFIALDEDNEKLQLENIRLRRNLLEVKSSYEAFLNQIPDSSRIIVDRDSTMPESKFTSIPCKAIGNTINSNYNYIVLNIGRNKKVVKEMGVISSNGVAGMVVAVSENYSLAMSLLNKKINISAKIKKKNILGTITWEGGDARYGLLKYVPQHVGVDRGDSIVTSGYSTMFPDGVMIGWVESVSSKNPDGFHIIKVRLATDFYKVKYLYLMEFEDKHEIDSLLNKNQ